MHIHDGKIEKSRLFWVILFNLGITIAEVIGGVVTGYLALLADAVHNLSDVGALILAWFGAKSLDLPASKRTTYGYKRVEVMTAFISAVTLVAISIWIFIEAYDRFKHPQNIEDPFLFLSIAVIGLLGNLLSIWMLHSEKGKSLNMKAAWLHMAYDALSSVGVILGGVLILLFNLTIIDPILSVLIGVMILWSSYNVIQEATMIFLEAVPKGIDFDEVWEEIEHIGKVKGVHDLHIWSISSSEVALSCHILLDEVDYADGPDVIIAINLMLREKFKIGHGTIQVEKSNQYECEQLHHTKKHLWE